MKNLDTKPSSSTDWAKIDALSDNDIDTSEIAPLGEDFFARATLQMPEQGARKTVILSVDDDVLQWFQTLGEDSRERMSAALRIYARAHQDQS